MALVKRCKIDVEPEVLARYVFKLDDAGPEISSRSMFGNDGPLEVEAGFGKGLFLINAAAANPGVNFLGIEISRKCAELTAKRLGDAEIDNVQLLLGDARTVFARLLCDGCVRTVHTYFPDPWWKRRHEKRRLFTGPFVQSVERVLEPKGELNIWTDVGDYFQMATGLIETHSNLDLLSFPADRDPAHNMDYLTHFERNMRQVNRAIYRASYRKCGL